MKRFPGEKYFYMDKLLIFGVVTFLLFSCQPTQQENISKTAKLTAGSLSAKEVVVYETAEKSKNRLDLVGRHTFGSAEQPLESEVSIFINPNKQFQTFEGIGGAVTDASAHVFYKMSKAQQDRILEAYYSKDNGIGYSLSRTTIHSCDFSTESYTYVSDEDKALGSFDISRDLDQRIPLIKRTIEAAGGSLRLYVSPWSPPAFMKSNKNMLRGGSLLKEYYPSWAAYYAKFIKAYEAEGIPIWGLTIQNEPMAVQRWESCIYTAEEERDFLRDHLGPTLEREGLGDKKIIVWDHNRDLINHRVNTILGDSIAAAYVWGVGFHWYEIWAGGEAMYDNLGAVQEAFPDVNLIFTEGCQERFDADKYQNWAHAERYGSSMINDFNKGTVAWTDWNILLDERGGPNHVKNFCFAPIHGDTKTDELIFTPSYYYIGHFSKFIEQGAKRVSAVSSRSHLLTTSFLNPDGKMATVVMNQSDKTIKYRLYVGDQATELSIPGHAMQTLIY